MIEPGQILQERYRVRKQIGQGGMGAVFVATDERFGSTVAIKETFFTDETLRKAFEREARLLNGLRHPALPRVSDHFIEGNGQFIVMEFIDGEDLSEQLEVDRKVFPVNEILGWADQLLDALEYLHTREMPVIHRDVKPQNLKLTPQGQIVLLDFGLAKGNPTTPDSATAAKSVFGYSRNYASIEQIQGSGTDPRSDLYSLAATLYHLLTGVPPADALTRAMNVLSGKPDPLVDAASIRPEIPGGVSHVLNLAMSLAAEDRPDSAAALRELLRDAPNRTSPVVAGSTAARANAGIAAPAALAGATNIFSQETKLHSDSAPPLGAPTLALADQDSKITELKPGGSTGGMRAVVGAAPAQAPTRSRGVLAGLAVGGLLLAGTAVAGIFMYAPRAAVDATPPVAPVDARVPAANAPANNATAGEPNTNQPSNAVAAAPGANVATPAAESRVPAAKADPKTATSDPKSPAAPEASERRTVIVTETPGPVTPRVPPPGDERFPPPATSDGRQVPPWVWQKMTPKERRELRQALEIQRQQKELERRRNMPQPTPPPN